MSLRSLSFAPLFLFCVAGLALADPPSTFDIRRGDEEVSACDGSRSATIIIYMSVKMAVRPTRSDPADRIERTFRALADRTRLRVLRLLQDGEFCVSDIINILRLPQAKVSHHLSYLRRAGLIEMRKEGLWSFYKLREARSPFHEKLLACLGQCFSGVPGLATDRARAAKIKASGGCCPK